MLKLNSYAVTVIGQDNSSLEDFQLRSRPHNGAGKYLLSAADYVYTVYCHSPHPA